MASLLSQHISKIRSPLGGEKVYKDECILSFDTPESETGLYICMSTFQGFGKKHVENYFKKSGNAVFLHMKVTKIEIPQTEDDPPTKKPTKLAIGLDGGFDVDSQKFRKEEHNSIVLLPDWVTIPLTDPNIPPEIQISAAAILSADSAAKQEEAAGMAGTWDGESRVVSKHAANLTQLDNGKKIPPSGWKCERCDKTDNLWLNLTSGAILCGRKFWDGTGGNNHAVDYYNETKYPLAVKLGTITPDGADVHSYEEDDMVLDPHLSKHLEHFGINISRMQKTDKTMTELEIDLNQKIGEWDVIQEAGSKLVPVYGPGLTGIRNLGNSCYLNSVVQMLFSVPDFKTRFCDASFPDTLPNNPTTDFNLQFLKLGKGLLSGDYSKPPPKREGEEETIQYQEGIKPYMFRHLIGVGHAEFSTKRQQDAEEFLRHMIRITEQNSVNRLNPCDALKYQIEERLECVTSKKVRYSHRSEYLMPLRIPMEAITNRAEVEAYEKKKKELEAKKETIDPKEIVRPKVPFSSCLESFIADELISDFYSPALNAKSTAKKSTRLSTFPDFLFIQLKKFTVGEDWTPKKLDVSVEMPDSLDLAHLKGKGRQAGEEELPEAKEPAPQVNIDETIVSQLVDMGFALEGCKKAVYHTQNAGVEMAMNWVMEHMADPDFSDPLRLPGTGSSDGGAFVPNEEALMMIMSMGFTKPQATRALKETSNNVERAADWIFSHQGELDEASPMETDGNQASGENFRDGSSKYSLVGFISHMGTSSMVGHYVCHMKKDGRWVIFNDEKVALSEHPPRDLGYLYLYRRD